MGDNAFMSIFQRSPGTIVVLPFVLIFVAARLGGYFGLPSVASALAHQLYSGKLGLVFGYQLFSKTTGILTGKWAAIGTLADGTVLRLNGLGVDPSRREVLARAKGEAGREADSWFVFGDHAEGGQRMDSLTTPRQARSIGALLGMKHDARVLWQAYWCRQWNGGLAEGAPLSGAGDPADAQRLVSVRLFNTMKLGTVSPDRGWIGVDGLRVAFGQPLACGRDVRNVLAEQGFADTGGGPDPPADAKAKQLLFNGIEALMLHHRHHGGVGTDPFRIDAHLA